MKLAKKILIIDDEKTLAMALKFRLTRHGFNTRIAFNGEEGLAILQQETFSLILLDLSMPKVDGFMVLADLMERKIKTPVIVLTNLGQSEGLRSIKEFGAKEFFIKSNTSISTIQDRIIELLK